MKVITAIEAIQISIQASIKAYRVYRDGLDDLVYAMPDGSFIVIKQDNSHMWIMTTTHTFEVKIERTS